MELIGSVPTFVGRERELEQLRAAVLEAAAGRGRVFLVVGEPGIGKTRLADELSADAGEAVVLWGRCWEGGGAPAYWPWVQVVRAWLRSKDGATVATAMGSGIADIAQIVPEVREVVPHVEEPPVLEGEHARFRLFDAATTFLGNASGDQPMLLILDDLHAADIPSLLLLQFVAKHVRGLRLVLVGTYRDFEVRRSHAHAQVLGDVARDAQLIPLRGLNREEVARVITALSGAAAPDPLVDEVHEATDGNPLFVDEVVRLLASEGRLHSAESSGAMRIHEGVRGVIRRRMETLPGEARRVLTVASVVGRDFELVTVARVCELGPPRVLAALDEAGAAGLVGERGLGHHAFSHALVREALYEDIGSSERVTLHLEVARAIETLHSSDLDPHLAELAHHFCRSAVAGDPEKALAYCVRAAERASKLLAHEEAVALYEHGLEALELAERPDEERRCELLVALGEARLRSGDLPEAREAFVAAADIARRRHFTELFARSALGMGRGWGEAGTVDVQALGLLEEALDTLGAAESPLRAAVLAALARALYYSESRDRLEDLSRQALEMARAVEDPEVLASALQVRHEVLFGPEYAQDRLRLATEVRELGDRARNPELKLWGHHWRLIDLLHVGEAGAAKAELEAHQRLADALRQPFHQWWSAIFRVTFAMFEGRFADAERLAAETYALGQRAHEPDAEQAFRMQMFLIARDRGQAANFEEILRTNVEQYPAVPSWRSALALIYVELDREAEARAEFEILAEGDFAALTRDRHWLPGATTLARIALYLRDARRASILYDLLSPFAGMNTIVSPGVAARGSTWRALGHLATALGRYDEAAHHYEQAIAMDTRMGARPFVAHSQIETAHVLTLRAGPADEDRAVELLSAALATARELGMDGVARTATAQLRRLGAAIAVGDDAGSAPRAPAGADVLTFASRRRRPAVQRADEPAAGVRTNVFHREGEFWTISYDGKTSRLKDAAGLRFIAELIARADREVHVLDLMTLGSRARAGQSTPAGGLTDAGEVLDPRAREAYRARLADLEEELDEARLFDDPARVAAAEEEIEALRAQLSQAFGLGGRARKASSPSERARVNVTRAVRAAIRKIEALNQPLGHHLSESIKTGTYCSYRRDPYRPVTWTL